MLEISMILLAGFWAGMINVVVGSGTLVTFPVLLLFGYPPIVANVSNNIGLVGGGLSGSWGYRKELTQNKELLRKLLPASLVGGLAGALLLLALPADAFKTIVPVLIAAGLVMVACGPAVQRRAARTRALQGVGAVAAPTRSRVKFAVLVVGTLVLGMYGGYFGAAQGILLIGLMSLVTTESMQHMTALKNVLTTGVNAIAAITFMCVAWSSIDWKVTALIAVGATLGGFAGARFGRRLSPVALRTLIITVGVVAIVKMVFLD